MKEDILKEDILKVERISDGSLLIRLKSYHSKHIKQMLFFKNFLLKYHYNNILIISFHKYNLRVFCTKEIHSPQIMLLFAKAMALYNEDRYFLVNNTKRQMNVRDRKFISQLFSE